MNTSEIDNNKENLRDSQRNINNEILQKLNQVLTEEGLNIKIEELLQVASTNKDLAKCKTENVCIKEDNLKMEVVEDVEIKTRSVLEETSGTKTNPDSKTLCAALVESVIDGIFLRYAAEKNERVDEKDSKDDSSYKINSKVSSFKSCQSKRTTLTAAREEQVVLRPSTSNEVCDPIKCNQADLSKEEDVILMEEVDLGLSVTQVSEMDLSKVSKGHQESIVIKDDINVLPEPKKPAEVHKMKQIHSNSENANVDVSLKNLWVSNIESITRAADLKQLFSKYGKVIGAKIVTDGWSGCYGYIAMATAEEADKCLKKFNNREVNGYKLEVSKKKPERLASRKKTREEAVSKKSVVPVVPPVGQKEEQASLKRKQSKEVAREKREMERLMVKRQKLDEEGRMLRNERMRQRKIEVKIREVQRKVDDDREKLRVEREQFEKEKFEILSLERERQRREREILEREKLEVEKMRKEAKKIKLDQEKNKCLKMEDKYKSPVRYREVKMEPGRRPSPVLNKHQDRKKYVQEYHGVVGSKSCQFRNSSEEKLPVFKNKLGVSKKTSDYLVERSNVKNSYGKSLNVSCKMSKPLEYNRSGYSNSSKEDKYNSFGTPLSRSGKRCSSPRLVSCESSASSSSWKQPSASSTGGGVSSKSYQLSMKSGWNAEHSWRPTPQTPAPPRIGWGGNNGGGSGVRANGATSGYGGGFSSSSARTTSSSNGIVCPSPPGVTYGCKFDGQGYSHCARKY